MRGGIMKKWMLYSFIFLNTIHNSLPAMEIQRTDTINHLFLLPMDILHYIAQFIWVWETEEDFIKRAQKESQKIDIIPRDYYTYYPDYKEHDKILNVFSADKSKIALFELLCGNCFHTEYCDSCPRAKLVIIDTQAKEEKNKIMYTERLEHKCYRALAVSSSGTMIAVIRKQNISENKNSIAFNEDYKDFLIIKKMNKDKKFMKDQEVILDMPSRFIPYHLAFNKQHTQLIMHGNDYSESDEGKEKHIMFGSNNIVFEGEDVRNNNALENYFRYLRVCKRIIWQK